MQRFRDFTNLALQDEDWAQINTRSRYHAKHPNQVFSEVEREKVVPDYLHRSFELYEQLEALRLAQLVQE